MNKPRILLLDEPHPKARAIMEEVAICKDMDDVYRGARRKSIALSESNNEESFLDSIIGIYTQFQAIPQTVHDLMDIKFIACPCTGTEHVTLPDGVKLIYLDEQWKQNEGREITSTAEHTFSLILQLAKMKRTQLSGKTLGIIGYGRIGQMVAKYAEAFGLKILALSGNEIIYNDNDKYRDINLHNEDGVWRLGRILNIPDKIILKMAVFSYTCLRNRPTRTIYEIAEENRHNKPPYKMRGVGPTYQKYVDLFVSVAKELTVSNITFVLKQSDIITLHIPLNDSTRGMIGEKEFAMMKDGTLLVNTSRAEVVDEKALINEAYHGRIGGYADDFRESHCEEVINMGMVEVTLYAQRDDFEVILTNHIAGNCLEAREATDCFIAKEIVRYINEL